LNEVPDRSEATEIEATEIVAAEIVAAGGVIWRDDESGRRFAVVHRPHRHDWSLAKGKLEPGEDVLAAAIREVWEETGFTVVVGVELATVRYADHRGRPKVVHYWSMEWESGEFVANSEVDELRWLDETEAVALLTYDVDKALVVRASQSG